VLKAKAKIRHLKSNYVFCNKNGNSIRVSNLHRAFYSAAKRSGLSDFRWHDLRHTFATRLVQAGVDLYTVQKLGRWKETKMVQRYAHHYPESLRRGIEVLDNVRKKISTNLAQLSDDGIGHDG
jgi:site-specific recombinase XerD